MEEGDVSLFQIVDEFVLGGFGDGLGSVDADDFDEHFEVEGFFDVLLVFDDLVVGELAVLDLLGVTKSRKEIKKLFGGEKGVVL